jgi:bifunctional non-homologous end joining protein LigD
VAHTVRVTHPDRLLYPGLGLTKRDLARFYAEIGAWILPHVARRPLTLVRCAKGVSAEDALRSQCQFMRHTPAWHAWVPELVPRVRIAEQRKLGEYLWIDGLPALLAIVNGYVVELHTWNATVVDFERARRAGKDLLDYKRNHRTSIAVAAFSTRARPHACSRRELGGCP